MGVFFIAMNRREFFAVPFLVPLAGAVPAPILASEVAIRIQLRDTITPDQFVAWFDMNTPTIRQAIDEIVSKSK